MSWITWAAVPLVIILLWLHTANLSKSFPTLKGNRIVLLIAHPDDEAMFFAPTMLALTRPELDNDVRILCLSTGNADGLGEIRKKELINSALQLGVRSESHVQVIDDAKFPDSMNATWKSRDIVEFLWSTFVFKQPKSSSPPVTNIDIIITFDSKGISSHPNHCSLYVGARRFVTELMWPHAGWESPVQLYTLQTKTVFRKYLSILDLPASVIDMIFVRKVTGPKPSPLFFVSGLFEYRAAQQAMTTAHKSQMVWFRWGWITMSRYMILNDLRKEKI